MQKTGLMKRRIEDKVGSEESFVAPGTKFIGSISGTEGVRVSGHLKGDIQSNGLVWIQRGGKIEGNIKSQFAIIEGELTGDINSSEHVELRSEARVTGNIHTAKIAIAEGSFFKGEIHMPSKEASPIRFAEKRDKKQNMLDR
jgi:cytoskeletal protein CcmA (bactofilin family)